MLGLAVTAACGGGGSSGAAPEVVVPAPTIEAADLVLLDGRIHLVDDAMTTTSALAVRDGRVLFSGGSTEAREFIADSTQVIELNGLTVLPGLHDVHLHPLEAGSSVAGTCVLNPGIDVLSEAFQSLLKTCAPRQRGAIPWVLGFGHSISQLTDLPSDVRPRDILDGAIPGQPVALLEETSHSVWVNSEALRVAGIEENTPDPVGGLIVRDQSGEPTGLLLDNAGDIVYELAFLPPTDVLQQLHYEGLLWALERIARNGITSIANARVYTRRGYLDVWRRAEREGTLTARTVLGLWAYPTLEPSESDADQIARLLSLYDNDADAMLRVSQVKFYSDGIYRNATAATLVPYLPAGRLPFFVAEDHRGLNYFDEARLARYVSELELAGFDAHIHAIGDRGVRESLNAIEQAISANSGLSDRRHRLTHIEEVDPDDVPRFADLGVVADFQLAGDFVLPVPGEGVDRLIPVREVYDTGARISLSSDWDVSALSPFVGIQNALQRAEQSLPSVEAALRAYTIDAAYVLRSEDRTGSLEIGKLADLVIVDQDIFTVPADQISETRVLMTVLGGETVYQAAGFNP